MNNRITLLLLFLLPGLNSCLDSQEFDFDKLADVEVQPTYALPLVHGSLGLEDLLSSEDSATLGVRDDQVLYFQYRKSFSSNSINEMLILPDAGIVQEMVLPADVTVKANERMIIPPGINASLSLSDISYELRSLLYKNGHLSYSINSTMGVPLQIDLTFPSISEAGAVFNQIIDVNSASGIPATGTSDLTGFEADLTTQSPGYNTIPFALTVTAINNTDTDITLKQGESVSASINFVDQDYKFVKGFFGDVVHAYPDIQVPIGPFGDELKYEANLPEIDLEMVVSNGYGVPIDVSFPVLEAKNEAGEVMNIQIDPSNNISVNSSETPGEEAKTNVNFMNEADIANFKPTEIKYDINAHLNKGLASGENFAIDSSRLTFDLTIVVPLIGSFTGITIEDTLDVNIEDDLGNTEIKKLALKTQLINQFPFGGKFQIYTLNSEQQITDSLLIEEQTDIITASSVTTDGDLATPGEYDEKIEISSEKFEKLTSASQLIIKAILDTSSGAAKVKFKSNYTLTVNLGILAEFETTIEP